MQRQNTFPWRHSGMKRPDVEGSLEKHIHLCAEGARRKPNLSGKRTETQACAVFALQSLWGLLFVLYREIERGSLLCTANL